MPTGHRVMHRLPIAASCEPLRWGLGDRLKYGEHLVANPVGHDWSESAHGRAGGPQAYEVLADGCDVVVSERRVVGKIIDGVHEVLGQVDAANRCLRSE